MSRTRIPIQAVLAPALVLLLLAGCSARATTEVDTSSDSDGCDDFSSVDSYQQAIDDAVTEASSSSEAAAGIRAVADEITSTADDTDDKHVAGAAKTLALSIESYARNIEGGELTGTVNSSGSLAVAFVKFEQVCP